MGTDDFWMGWSPRCRCAKTDKQHFELVLAYHYWRPDIHEAPPPAFWRPYLGEHRVEFNGEGQALQRWYGDFRRADRVYFQRHSLILADLVI